MPLNQHMAYIITLLRTTLAWPLAARRQAEAGRPAAAQVEVQAAEAVDLAAAAQAPVGDCRALLNDLLFRQQFPAVVGWQ